VRSTSVRKRIWKICIAAAIAAAPNALAQEPELYVIGVHPHGIVVFDGTRNEIAGQIQTRGRAPKELVPSPDGKFVYVTSDGRSKLEVVNLQTRTVDKVLELAPPGYRLTIFGVALNSKGDRLYVHVKPVRELIDRYVVDPPQVWSVDPATGKTQKIAEVPQGVAALALTRDDRQLLAWGRDLYYIDLAQGRITDTFRLMNPVNPTDGALNTLALFIQFERSGIFSIPYYTKDPITSKDLMGLVNLDVNTGHVDTVELGAPIPLYSAVVSPDRKRAYAVMNQLVAVDLERKRVTKVIDLERTRYVANISRDGKRVFVSGAAPFIHVYDADTLELLKTIELPGDPAVTAFRALPPGALGAGF
jgi:DNA-binding beta-propeller fold protein YncE